MKLSRKPISATFAIFSAVLFYLAPIYPLCAQDTPLPLFGPAKFERTTGAPEDRISTFQACNTGAAYRLVVENGAGGKDRVSSATIRLNGVELVRPSDLNQRVERVEKEVALQGDNTLNVRLTSNPGGYLTVSLFCESGCLDVAIASPVPESTVNRAQALVKGDLLNVHGETGVVLTSAGAEGEAAQLAQVRGDLFAGLVPLQAGENTITATATDACGYQVRKEITVHTDSAQEKLQLSALPPSGILGASGTFETELEADAYLSEPITQYAWDFDGDGTAEQTGADLPSVTAQYAQPGIYFPRVTIIDAQGASYWETAVVNVLTREEMDVLLKAKWDKMKEGLKSGDVEQALKSFSNDSKERYRGIFTALQERLADIAAGMNEIQLIYLKDGRAKYRTRRQEETGEATYYIYFARDEDGFWKIHRF